MQTLYLKFFILKHQTAAQELLIQKLALMKSMGMLPVRIMQLQTRRARERTQSRPLRLAQDTQAPVHERAILIDQRHHVGDGGDRDEIQKPLLPAIWYRDETLHPAFLAFSHECLCNFHGITTYEARTRAQKFGPNVLVTERKQSAFVTFLGEFKNPLVLVLL
jgi:magnesium-transporting ATPase (P-type)